MLDTTAGTLGAQLYLKRPVVSVVVPGFCRSQYLDIVTHFPTRQPPQLVNTSSCLQYLSSGEVILFLEGDLRREQYCWHQSHPNPSLVGCLKSFRFGTSHCTLWWHMIILELSIGANMRIRRHRCRFSLYRSPFLLQLRLMMEFSGGHSSHFCPTAHTGAAVT